MHDLLTTSTTIAVELRRRSRLEPAQIAQEAERFCCFCGERILPVVGEFPHPTRPGVVSRPVIWPKRHGCPQEAEHLARAVDSQAEALEKHRRELWLNTLDRAGLIGWLRDATLDTFQQRADWPDAAYRRGRVAEYVAALLTGRLERKSWLILYGDYGTGKSHLAAGVIRAAIEAGWRQCYFRAWTEYLGRLQASWGRRRDGDEGETEYDIAGELQEGRLVVIDDLDKRRPTDWTREVLFGVINHRYNAHLPTVLTFNYAPDALDPEGKGRLALETYLGRAVLDRVIGAAFDVVEFAGPSYRLAGVKP